VRRLAALILSAIATLVLVTSGSAADATPLARVGVRAPVYRAAISPLSWKLRTQMRGSSWHPGCPVALDDLRLIQLTYWGFDGSAHRGKLVVHRWWAHPVAKVFGKLYDARFPIRRMRLIDAYGAEDKRSMRADNTSAFNCRYRNGVCCTWSQHAFGRAIDIDPVENPYVGPWGSAPPNGAGYVDRSPVRKGMIVRGDVVWSAFRSIGWYWGGSWSWPIDYQHFSSNDR
jgi:D-alanyl-D-alanine carboxypeptidase